MKYATGASTPIISVANIGKIEIPLYDAAKQRELEEKAREIEKIVLYDDVHAASGWDILKDYIDIPIEYTLIERLKDNKSLADIKVTAGICKEYYENDVDSIILVSSDSDYWGLIETVPQIRFLVMVEHEKCSSAVKGALLSKNIIYCYIDDFYQGGGNEIKEKALYREANRCLNSSCQMNVYDIIGVRVLFNGHLRDYFINR